MTKLNQLLAVESGAKTGAFEAVTKAHQNLQKGNLLSGISRTYRPLDDEGERLPGESTRVQVTADQVISEVSQRLVRLFDLTATKDDANCRARADVEVNGKVLLSQVPATTLLFLEKQLVDLHTFVKKLPVLDPAEHWTFDTAQACWVTDPAETVRTKKVLRNHVKAEATDKHPAQVEVYTEDVGVGRWHTIKFSGAMPQSRINQLLFRVEELQRAVKHAREEANGTEVTDKHIGATVFSYLFAA